LLICSNENTRKDKLINDAQVTITSQSQQIEELKLQIQQYSEQFERQTAQLKAQKAKLTQSLQVEERNTMSLHSSIESYKSLVAQIYSDQLEKIQELESIIADNKLTINTSNSKRHNNSSMATNDIVNSSSNISLSVSSSSMFRFHCPH